MIMKKNGIVSNLSVLSHPILSIIRNQKNTEEIAKEVMEEECFEEICSGLASNVFSALMKSTSGSNLAVRSENREKVISVLHEILPMVKIIGKNNNNKMRRNLSISGSNQTIEQTMLSVTSKRF